ncbi:unnamed protein product, partial [marine sediment metagenome]
MNVQSYNTWFKPLVLMDFSPDSIVISVPKTYYSSWLEEHYMPLLKSTAKTLLNNDVSVKFIVSSNIDLPDDTQESPSIFQPDID